MRIEAGRALKWLYCLSLIAAMPLSLFGSVGWVGLATGGGLMGGGIIEMVFILALVIYRIVMVVRNPHTLDAVLASKWIRLLRYLSILLMVIGLIGSIMIFFIKPLALRLFGTPGDAGIAYFVVGIVVYLIASLEIAGLVLFEASRLIGSEAQTNNKSTQSTVLNIAIKQPKRTP